METSTRNGQRIVCELVVVWGDELRVFALGEGRTAIGRAEDNQVRIEHESVSRWHATLRIGQSLVIEDLGTANGTFVPDRTRRSSEPGQTQRLCRLVRDSAELGVGDNIVLGAVSAVLRRPSAPIGADAESAEVGGGPPEAGGAMRVLLDQAERAAAAAISVLILGETGVGKEVLARRIHAASPRAKQVFLGLNCAAFGEQLLEGELFGYERGAFTGAVEARPGLFEAADGGTVFLDEVGELPLSTQAKLLRVLEARTVLRLGARKPRAIDVRFVAATNRDLESAVAMGTFRRDLFYRLDGISLTIPPLRDRPGELAPLARVFLAAGCHQLERRTPHVSEEALRALAAHDWPGNVRELKNAIERALVLCADDVIRPEHFPRAVLRSWESASPPVVTASSPPRAPIALGAEGFLAQVSALERARIVDALGSANGNQTEAAKLLGMSRRTLASRLDALALPRPRKRNH